MVVLLLALLFPARAEECEKGEGAPCCPPVAAQGDPWAAAEGLDVRVVSRGEEFSLRDQRQADKVVVVEFGARWCGPCWEVAGTLTQALRERPWLAVRAVELPGKDAFESFEAPAARQHLAQAAGIPWLVVLHPKGRVLYQGSSAEQALAAADRVRR